MQCWQMWQFFLFNGQIPANKITRPSAYIELGTAKPFWTLDRLAQLSLVIQLYHKFSNYLHA